MTIKTKPMHASTVSYCASRVSDGAAHTERIITAEIPEKGQQLGTMGARKVTFSFFIFKYSKEGLIFQS